MNSATANLFNVGNTQNIGQGASALASPTINASNAYNNALQQLQAARIANQQGISQTSMGLQNQQTQNYLQSLTPGPLDYAALGLTAYGAYQGITGGNAMKAAAMPQNSALNYPNGMLPQNTGGS